MSDTVTALPPPRHHRWRPARAGLISLWRYWDETFKFHRGRLLFRGPNGSGKSMALELLLPFLLDADASPTRLTSAAKSRGGLYERVMTGSDDSSRAGFAWVEFRRDTDVFTVGARLRASASTRKVDLDFFTTTQTVGTELLLLDGQRVPLSRKRLVEAIGDRGRVHASSEEHRSAVRAALFPGFSADRYASVVTALLALRKEKLSQNLDLAKLSDVLSEALPPIDDHDVAAVAEGFERLDRRRAELAALEAELDEVKLLAARQRAYARAVAAAVAGDVRAAETRRDHVTRSEREALASLEAARAEAAALEAEAVDFETRLAAVDVEVDALRASDAYREGADLDDLRAESRRLRALVERDRGSADQRAHEHAEATAFLESAATEVGQAMAHRDRAEADLRQAAVSVAAEAVVGDAATIADAEGAERFVHAWVGARRQLVAELRAAIGAHQAAVQHRTFVEGQVADDEGVADERAAAVAAATAAHDAAAADYAAAVGDWSKGCDAIGAVRVLAALPERPSDPAIVEAAVARLDAEVTAEHAAALRDLEARTASVADERIGLLAERTQFIDGRVVEPEAPPWRADRSQRPGAPLWRLVDVAAGADPADIDGLEAALTAAGLVDAWVSPDGSVDLADAAADVTLTARPIDGASLADLLVALGGGPVPTELVTQVLASVAMVATVAGGPVEGSVAGTGAGASPEVVVGRDGTFRLGAAVGRGQAQAATLLGAEAQERRRLSRLAELDAAIADADTRLAELGREADGIARWQEAAAAELAARPRGDEVVATAAQLAGAVARRAEAGERLASSRRTLVAAEEQVREALRSLTRLGARHQLPTDDAGLSEFDGVLAALERAAAGWARRRRELSGAERTHSRAAADAERAEAAVADAVAHHASSVRDCTAVEGRLATLESSIGAEYRQLLTRLGVLDDQRRVGRERARHLAGARPQLERRIGNVEAALAAAEAARLEADAARAATHLRFAALVADGVAADAGVEATGSLDGVTATLAAARAMATELDGVAADAPNIERASSRVDERLHSVRSTLSGRVDFSRELGDDGWWVLRAAVSGVRRRAPELSSMLAHELETSRAEFRAEEERLFEQVLAGSVRRALAERIRLANRLVDGINTQLATVRTAAGGVAVRLRWEVDPEQLDAVKAARSLLLRDPADLTADETAALQAFVRARVDQARAELETNAPWEARLRETLDYRSWHRFTLQLGHRDWDGFQPATARRLQRLSTGERSIALHLPMLASIAAHYTNDQGEPGESPRLILLDELFAGVDTTNRAQLFRTFTDWDLDAVLTSDHEWCQYATLDGIAIHHLHPPSGDDPVTSTRFTWDGRRRTIDAPAA